MPSIAIAGLGVIGGSLAKALAAAGYSVHAFSLQRAERELARRSGLTVVEMLADLPLAQCDAAVVAVPLDRIAAVARDLRSRAGDGCVLMHTGSLQTLAAAGANEGDGNWLIGTHPMAGSEGSGFADARAELFANATISVDTSATPNQRAVIEATWRAAGASLFVWRSAEQHDQVMSWASHLPQLTATALALTLARAGVPASEGGPGLRDTTRLAASSLLMWRPILDAADQGCITALASLERSVGELRHALESGDQELLSEMWSAARSWRSAMESPRVG